MIRALIAAFFVALVAGCASAPPGSGEHQYTVGACNTSACGQGNRLGCLQTCAPDYAKIQKQICSNALMPIDGFVKWLDPSLPSAMDGAVPMSGQAQAYGVQCAR